MIAVNRISRVPRRLSVAGAYSTTYTLDAEGRRTSQSVTVGGSTATTSFTLNAADELTATSSTTGGFTNSYSYNDNGEQTGRTLSGTTYTAGFDYDGQMTSLSQGSSTTAFGYDAMGRRISRTAGGTETDFQYDGNSMLLEKQGSTTTATYTYGTALVRKDGETPLYDGLGSARAETSSAQAITNTLVPDTFGNAIATTGSTGSKYGFAATSGYRADGDAGLSKVGARYYDAQTGTFTTRDNYLDEKPYAYCEHDPANWVDPTGHHCLRPTPHTTFDQDWIAIAPIRGAIGYIATGTLLAIAFPVAAATAVGSVIIGGVAGAVGVVSSGDWDPGHIAVGGGVSAVGGWLFGMGLTTHAKKFFGLSTGV